MTALELITEALIELGEVGQGETVSNEDATGGLLKLNDYLASLSNDRLNIYKLDTFSGTLTATVGSYTFGPSGTLVSSRPVQIQGAVIVLNGITQPLNLITAPQYRAIKEKALTGTLPLQLYPNSGFPNMTLEFWPVPSGTPTFTCDFWAVIAGGNLLLGDTISLPPGYQRMLRLGLAIELAPSYGRQVSEILLRNFQDAYALVRNNNNLDTSGVFGMTETPNLGEPGGQKQ